jgi:aspartyl-tRNA(Asn)/glutamyl-tRNA(Gln) amidotransferase subunit B
MSMVDGSPKLADELAAELGLAVDNDRGRLIGFVETVLREHPSEADKYRAGRERVLAFLVGQVLKLSKGRASPELAAELLKEHLKR